MGGMAMMIGRSVGLSDDSIRSSLSMYETKMRDAMNNNCVNVSVLMERYLRFCQGLQQDPDARLREILRGNTCNSSYKCK
jgi:hypothetical protein